jgi:hypothetical protein
MVVVVGNCWFLRPCDSHNSLGKWKEEIILGAGLDLCAPIIDLELFVGSQQLIRNIKIPTRRLYFVPVQIPRCQLRSELVFRRKYIISNSSAGVCSSHYLQCFLKSL